MFLCLKSNYIHAKKKSFFKPSDKIISFVTHRTYLCNNNNNFYMTSNLCNLIFIITCSNSFDHYVGEAAQLPERQVRFVTSRSSMSGKKKASFLLKISGSFHNEFI